MCRKVTILGVKGLGLQGAEAGSTDSLGWDCTSGTFARATVQTRSLRSKMFTYLCV